MNKIEDGGPAFPQHDLSAYGFGPSQRGEWNGPDDPGTARYTVEGMSLRDWFAGQALASAGSFWSDEETRAEYAKRSYLMADAMIAARKGGAA